MMYMCNINLSKDRDTPLHSAAAYGHIEAVKVLIQSGAMKLLEKLNKASCLIDCY